MDISFKYDDQKFNYRVCAMLISDNRILAMHDERSPYFYLPGGRVTMGETAEQAVIREVQEELGITTKIIRPVWLNQAFFTEDVDHLRYHELCIYFFDETLCSPQRRGPSVIIGSQKTQIYQWFAGSQQEVFILKILKFENNAAQQGNGRRFHI